MLTAISYQESRNFLIVIVHTIGGVKPEKNKNYFICEKALTVKIDLNKKLDPKQKTIQVFNIDAQRLRKTKMKIL